MFRYPGVADGVADVEDQRVFIGLLRRKHPPLLVRHIWPSALTPAHTVFRSSGTTGSKLYKYDLATLGETAGFPASPIDVFEDHSDTIRDLSCHPWQNELIMTAR